MSERLNQIRTKLKPGREGLAILAAITTFAAVDLVRSNITVKPVSEFNPSLIQAAEAAPQSVEAVPLKTDVFGELFLLGFYAVSRGFCVLGDRAPLQEWDNIPHLQSEIQL